MGAAVKVDFKNQVTDLVIPGVDFGDVSGYMIKEEICRRTGILPEYQTLYYICMFSGAGVAILDGDELGSLFMESKTILLRVVDKAVSESVTYIPDE